MSYPSTNLVIATLILALVALLTAVLVLLVLFLQLYQALLAVWDALPTFDEEVMGGWGRYTRRKIRYFPALRVEVEFETPVIFLAPADNTRGPVWDKPIWYADGSIASCESTRTEVPDIFTNGMEVDEKEHTRKKEKELRRERISTLNNQRATWVNLLVAIQKMERESAAWESMVWRQSYQKPRPLLQEVTSLAVGIQSNSRKLHQNTGLKKPYASTTISHLVELAAILGIYWREFDRDLNRFRAEGNGFSLLGHRQDFGIVFSFERTGWSHFMETRVIPTSEIKELCFGNVPTFYRTKDRLEDEVWKVPFKQRTLQTLQLGSLKEIVKTLNLIGCDAKTTLYYSEGMKHIHLFPVIFEVVGMLGRTLHIRDRCFTCLPNPTIFPWDDQSFSLPRLLRAFTECLRNNIGQLFGPPPIEMEQISMLAQNLVSHLPKKESTFSPLYLNQLHDAIDQTDTILSQSHFAKDVVLDVIRRHLQAVLLSLNTSAEEAGHNMKLDGSRVPTNNSFEELLSVPPEARERGLMRKYFSEIRPRVISVSPKEDPHYDSDQEEEQLEAPATETRDPPPPARLTSSSTWHGVHLGRSEIRRNSIWCVVTFRMICWLLVHKFDEKDVQVPKSELMGSRLPVYIM